MPQTLHQTLTAIAQQANQEGFFAPFFPDEIVRNLKMATQIRPYQLEALGRFVYFMEQGMAPHPTQLLFQMATGSGKTLVMAALMLYLYGQGYRNFLFFVNSTNIINKTKDNFLNPHSPKYLFAPMIAVNGGKPVLIKEVTNFQTPDEQNINLLFTTVQALHSSLNNPHENGMVAEDFEQQKLILISDEAHHLNAETKKGNIPDAHLREEVISWEATVNKIFNANANNMLLEFTATANLSIPEIRKKYSQKLIFDYSLRQFRQHGYSKEVKVWQAQLPPFQRALQAVILSQYRQKVFAKYGIAAKPVILFKSKTIAESRHFFDAFSSGIQKLTTTDLTPFLQLNSNSLLQQVNSFLQNENISLENFVLEIKEAFAFNKLISVNSKEESEEKQIALNTLEQPDNLYRAVFAVDKLNEGWDVLNLFDIVRLYDTHQTAKTNAPIAKTTVAEAQLIGRGARYFPFTIGNNLPVFQRKFDTHASHPLRICEELYYHSPYNPAYIHELSLALQHTGIKAALSTLQPIELKTAFTQTPLYQHGFVWVNQQLKCPPPKQHTLPNQLLKKPIALNWFTGTEQTDTLFNLTPANEPAAANAAPANKHKMKLSSIEPAILRKAICQLPFFQFANLRAIFPKLNSISEFMNSPHFLGGVTLEIHTPIAYLSVTNKLNVAKTALQQIAHQLQKPTTAYMGSTQFEPLRLNKVITNKTVMIHQEYAAPLPNKLSLLAPQLPHYVLQQDDHLHQQTTQLLCNACQTLQLYFKEVYLLKNIGYITLYHTQNGAPVQPQYVLWVTSGSSDAAVYQIFIEISSSLPHLQPMLYHRSLQVLQNQSYHIVWIQTGTDALSQPNFGEKLRAVLM